MSGDNELTFSAPVNLLNSSTITSFAAPNLGATIQFSSHRRRHRNLLYFAAEAGTRDVIFGGKVGHQTPLANLIFRVRRGFTLATTINVTGANPLVLNTYVILTGNSNITFVSTNRSSTYYLTTRSMALQRAAKLLRLMQDRVQ